MESLCQAFPTNPRAAEEALMELRRSEHAVEVSKTILGEPPKRSDGGGSGGGGSGGGGDSGVMGGDGCNGPGDGRGKRVGCRWWW